MRLLKFIFIILISILQSSVFAQQNQQAPQWPYYALAGAAILSTTNLDRQLVNTIADHNIIFGSRENANQSSDNLREILAIEWVSSIIFLEENKIETLFTDFVIVQSNFAITDKLKEETHRDRPQGAGATNSFPSAHTSSSFAYAHLVNSHWDHVLRGKNDVKYLEVEYFNNFLASLVGWSRLEANQHYPSDVLAGAALGELISYWMLSWPKKIHIRISPNQTEIAYYF